MARFGSAISDTLCTHRILASGRYLICPSRQSVGSSSRDQIPEVPDIDTPIPLLLLDLLACPRDRGSLRLRQDYLECAVGHRYPVVEGVPVMLVEEVDATHPYCSETLRTANTRRLSTGAPEGLSQATIDPFVQKEIVGTCGNLYRHLEGRLPRYPIPELPLPRSDGSRLLDLGCNWGRWSIAAGLKGYTVVGLDPSLEALLAARRVAVQLGTSLVPVAGDGRFLPFQDDSFQVVFSYSVLQHMSKSDVRFCLNEASRVTVPHGSVVVQMPNRFGVRQVFNQLRRGFRPDTNPFRVRYWSRAELKLLFEACIGSTRVEIDGFFSLNAQRTDLDLMGSFNATVIRTSEALRRVSSVAPWLASVADSLYVRATNFKAYQRAAGATVVDSQ